ncbi:MAG: cytochrome b5 domain-containing protein [Candidatus Planktophila sp.]|nr:cytochrome b5 domain-containing protein [Candidatus Planktophila sp.]
MKRIISALGMTLVLSIVIAPSSSAAVKAGDACKKVGQTSVAGGFKYTCVKKGSKMVWGKGVAVKATAAAGAGYTLAKVKDNASVTSCWSVINGNVYDLTKWISSHPGGESAILSLCGTDGSAAFASQHAGKSKPESRLAGYLLGPLVK